MIFTKTTLDGACVVDLEPRIDERGFFARGWCRREFEEQGLAAEFVQGNVSYTGRKGTIRGLHYQVAPCREAKLVRCIRGAIWDVIIDLRPDSRTYLEWLGLELTAENRRQVYIPEGFAHGYQTLADESEILYQVTAFYAPEAERGIRWNDPRFDIRWPEADRSMSPKDAGWPDFAQEPDRRPGDAGSRTEP